MIAAQTGRRFFAAPPPLAAGSAGRTYHAKWLNAAARRMRAATDALRGRRAPDGPAPSGVAEPLRRPERAGRPGLGRPREAPAAANVRVAAERLQAFADAGYGRVAGTSKVTLFRGEGVGREVYLVNANRGIKVAVHPDLAALAQAAADRAECQVNGLYHNDNMTRFPRRMNGGGEPVHYGIGVACRTAGGLTGFLRIFDVR